MTVAGELSPAPGKAPVTLITGTRKGIGKALAQHFCRKGHVVVGCSRKVPDWREDGYHHHLVDVTDEAAVTKLFHDIRNQHGGLDHLINNAGIASMNHALLTPMSSVSAVLATNLSGAFLFSREAARLMTKGGFGRIVNFSTVAVPLRLQGEAVYAASKAGVEMLTKILAQELGQLRITVNCIGPTPIETDLIKAVPKAKIDAIIARQAIGRLGRTGDVINVVDFFLSRESDFVTGQTIYLGGL